MISNKTLHVKKFSNPTEEEIPILWMEFVALESIAPNGLREGIARARTALLASVPAWQLPTFLDSLAFEGATA